MMEALAPIGLASVTAALLAVPILPAVYELRKRGDVAPLPTSRHDGRIENFADAFRSRIAPVIADLDDYRARGEVGRIETGGMTVLLVGRQDFSFDFESMRGVDAIVCSQATIPPGRLIPADIYASEGLRVEEGAAVRAAFVDGDVTIASRATVFRWLHSSRRVFLQKAATSYGRLSSLESIYLEPGSRFERVHAPHIFTLSSLRTGRSEGDLRHGGSEALFPAKSDSFDRDVFVRRRRVRVHGDFVLPAGDVTSANVIAAGEVRLGAGARFDGSIKSYKDMVVDEGVSVRGSIVCGATLHLRANCFVTGPVMAEREIRISRGARIGAADSPTTISSPEVHIATGCQIHGTIWARISGTIED